MARIVWTCRVEADPGEPITEVPQWDGRLNIDVADNTTNLVAALMSCRMLSVQFVERFLEAMGAEKDARGYLKDYFVAGVNLRPRDDGAD